MGLNVPALLEAGLDVIIMSIDSLKKDVFESIRVRLDFDEVLENAKRFIRLRNEINPSTRIWMRMIRQEENKDEWICVSCLETNYKKSNGCWYCKEKRKDLLEHEKADICCDKTS